MLFKIQHIRTNSIITVILLCGLLVNFTSCNNRDIDCLIRESYESNDTIIRLSDLYQEDWDTVYFFGACSMEDIDKRLGRSYNIWEDIGDKMLITNQSGNIVYYKEWDMVVEGQFEGAAFILNNDSLINAIPREKAIFRIRKRNDKSFWVILLDK